MDGKEISISESDTVFLTINKRTKVSHLIPGNALVRFQFCELLMRLGLKRLPNIKNLDDRMSHFLQEYVIHNSPIEKAQDFRWSKYWNEQVDNLYKFHIKLLQEIYNNYSGQYKKPGEENFMSSAEFETIWEHSKLQNERFANRDINVCFNLAMQTRVDEYNSDKHLKMQFVEFLEALARAANYLSYPPSSTEIKEAYKSTTTQNLQDFNIIKEGEEVENDFEMSPEELTNQPLYRKIEHILPNLLLHCTNRNFRKKWTWPIKNPKYNLYEDYRPTPETSSELKSAFASGINKLIFSKMNLKEILLKKKLEGK